MIDSFGLILANSSCVAETINNLEIELLKYDQVECSVYHHFSPGIYIREVNIPAGTFSIGHFQKTEHLNIFLKGRVTMLNDDGSTSELIAPMIFTGKPGRKCGYIHEDMVWLNVYPTSETDIEKLESIYLDKSAEWVANQPEKIQRFTDIEDYKNLLTEYGFTDETVKSQVENELDQIPFPSGSYSVGVFDSSIDGKGLFATGNFKAGDIIAPAIINGLRTPAGRYTNHSLNSNAKMIFDGQDIYLIATKDISGCSGGQLGDEITTNYRETISMQINGVKKCLL